MSTDNFDIVLKSNGNTIPAFVSFIYRISGILNSSVTFVPELRGA
jgi:hypothetical protein